MAFKVFCMENTVGIMDKGQYYPEENFDEKRFREILTELILSKKHFSADLLLKEGIKKYFGLKNQIRHYKGKTMSDSEFYLRWREVIMEDENFKVFSSETWKKELQTRRKARAARRSETNWGAFAEDKIKTAPSITKKNYK